MAWVLSGFGDEIDQDPHVQVSVLQALGARHIEVRSAWGINIVELPREQLEELKLLLDARGMGVSAVASPVGKVSVELPVEHELARLDAAITAARVLGTRYVRVFSFYFEGDAAAARDAVIERMRALAARAEEGGVVLLHEHAPMFWFPRDCPRGCIWPVSTTTDADRERFFGQTRASRIHVIERGWATRLAQCRLFAYRLPTEAFEPHEVGGYWIANEQVEAQERRELSALHERHASAGIELRITPSIWEFWDQVVRSSVEFSGMRLRNAPRPA